MGTVVLIGGEKGGTGKSTIATNLAAYLALEKQDVILLDADPQGTAKRWVDRRNDAGLPTVHCSQKSGNLIATIRDLATRYEHVIIDAGGRDSQELRSAMVVAEKMYVPLRASQPDLDTLPRVCELINTARTINEALQVHAILSMAPSNQMITEIGDAQELLKDFHELKLSGNIIGDRKIYRDAMTAGKGAVEMTNAQAKAEIQLLAAEIYQS